MGFQNELLWEKFCEKARSENTLFNGNTDVSPDFISAVKKIALLGVDRSKTIQNSFPMFTLHDETHICNVMRIMAHLLGTQIDNLTRNETAMLVLVACCHDIGMSVSEQDKLDLLKDVDRINKYLDNNHSEYVKAYSEGADTPHMTDDMIMNYFRTIHHDRIWDIIGNFEWPEVLEGNINKQDLIRICQSHGNDITTLSNLEPNCNIDMRFCAILLRLSDILDFDTSRAPRAVYEYSGLNTTDQQNLEKSKEEWNKHFASRGFDFLHASNHSSPYPLDYHATCRSMQVEQTVNNYLDWVDKELADCERELQRYNGNWSNFILPSKINRNIVSEGYVSGQYCLTLDQQQVMDLLVGKDLYSDSAVFVRELIQNSIDAVRTRKQLDRNLPPNWKPQINIRTWMDSEGYYWFRIEDNGIGMSEDIIKKFFLKIGCSYYNSDTFKKEKIRCGADQNYMPISRFGIGLLSCFMGDKDSNRVEISTKRFNENGNYYPALRMSMHGMNGYYYMASREKHHLPGPMLGVTKKEKEQYLNEAGTVIAVRTNLYQTGKYKSFKEIVDHYVIYPPVAIHYDGAEGSFDYPTEAEFIEDIKNIAHSTELEKQGLLEFPLSEDNLKSIQKELPQINFTNPPKLLLKCISLENYTESEYLSGATLATKVIGEHKDIQIEIANVTQKAKVRINPFFNKGKNELGLEITLIFDSRFTEKMRFLDRSCSEYEYFLEKQLSRVLRENDYDFYTENIIHAISKGIEDTSSWQNDMIVTFNITLSELQSKIIKTRKQLEKNLSKNYNININDFNLWRTYKKMNKSWNFTLCSLENFNWFNKHFKTIEDRTGTNNVVSHNGIFCGQSYFFQGTNNDHEKLHTIIILKDKYRPQMDVSRDGIRELPLETACDLDFIKKQLAAEGFEIYSNSSNKQMNLPMKEYKSLLYWRPDLEKNLTISTKYGNLSSQELTEMLSKKHIIELTKKPQIANEDYWYRKSSLYDYLLIAYLKNTFSIRCSISKYDSKIFIIPKEPNENICEEIFPANYFVKALDNTATKALTTKNSFCRYCFNGDHKLSIFLLENGEKLKKHVPGILSEILRALCNDENTELVSNINNMLFHLRSLHNAPFKITDDLFLSESDLV